MAKKGARIQVGLVCTICKRLNYITQRNKNNTPEKLVMVKYCRTCKKRTEHREAKNLK